MSVPGEAWEYRVIHESTEGYTKVQGDDGVQRDT